ncbi:MAG: 50S ribosomal protein L24 [Flavobacteriaceae bacterium]|nr:50S ribosomal protein L24 [Flavobacteriaceae bacterium]|tara:strand:+ start:24187 stop:24501 length:315 start_codon:yes stop_codon:yes gene_type:complete
MLKKIKIKKGDLVKVISGEHKGSDGSVIKIMKGSNKIIIEGINIVKKHKKPDSNNPQGGIVENEAPIDISNVSLVTSDGKPTRVGFRFEDGIKVRFSKKTDELI